MTRACIDRLVSFGADVQHSWGCSDPALHRCIIAGKAWNVLKEDKGKYQYMIWIDDDMVCGDGYVQLMRSACKQTGASISGVYCKRGCSGALALREWDGLERQCAFELKEPVPIEGIGSVELAESITLRPVIGGMGCLMVPREAFLKHVSSVPNVHRRHPDGKRSDMPGVCSSGFCPDDRGKLGWLSEDLVYGQSLWHWATGIYMLPLAWGHLSEVQLLPSQNAIWLNARDEDDEEETTQPSVSAEDGQKGFSVNASTPVVETTQVV